MPNDIVTDIPSSFINVKTSEEYRSNHDPGQPCFSEPYKRNTVEDEVCLRRPHGAIIDVQYWNRFAEQRELLRRPPGTIFDNENCPHYQQSSNRKGVSTTKAYSDNPNLHYDSQKRHCLYISREKPYFSFSERTSTSSGATNGISLKKIETDTYVLPEKKMLMRESSHNFNEDDLRESHNEEYKLFQNADTDYSSYCVHGMGENKRKLNENVNSLDGNDVGALTENIEYNFDEGDFGSIHNLIKENKEDLYIIETFNDNGNELVISMLDMTLHSDDNLIVDELATYTMTDRNINTDNGTDDQYGVKDNFFDNHRRFLFTEGTSYEPDVVIHHNSNDEYVFLKGLDDASDKDEISQRETLYHKIQNWFTTGDSIKTNVTNSNSNAHELQVEGNNHHKNYTDRGSSDGKVGIRINDDESRQDFTCRKNQVETTKVDEKETRTGIKVISNTDGTECGRSRFFVNFKEEETLPTRSHHKNNLTSEYSYNISPKEEKSYSEDCVPQSIFNNRAKSSDLKYSDNDENNTEKDNVDDILRPGIEIEKDYVEGVGRTCFEQRFDSYNTFDRTNRSMTGDKISLPGSTMSSNDTEMKYVTTNSTNSNDFYTFPQNNSEAPMGDTNYNFDEGDFGSIYNLMGQNEENFHIIEAYNDYENELVISMLVISRETLYSDDSKLVTKEQVVHMAMPSMDDYSHDTNGNSHDKHEEFSFTPGLSHDPEETIHHKCDDKFVFLKELTDIFDYKEDISHQKAHNTENEFKTGVSNDMELKNFNQNLYKLDIIGDDKSSTYLYLDELNDKINNNTGTFQRDSSTPELKYEFTSGASTDSDRCFPTEVDEESKNDMDWNDTNKLGLVNQVESGIVKREKDAKLKLFHVIQELIESEKSYQKCLEVIVMKYEPHLKRAAEKQKLTKEYRYIFINIVAIFETSQLFYQDLIKCEDDVQRIGQAFLKYEKEYHDLYLKYSKYKPQSDYYINQFLTDILVVKELINDRLDLRSHLLVPIQRLGKYILLLANMEKYCLILQLPYEKTIEAKNMFQNIMRESNDVLAIDSIRRINFQLYEFSPFIMRQEFLMIKPLPKAISMVFFFDGIIVFTRKLPKLPEKYAHWANIRMSHLQLGESRHPKHVYLKNCKNSDEYIIEAPRESVKLAWHKEIETRLWKQFLEIKKLNYEKNTSTA